MKEEGEEEYASHHEGSARSEARTESGTLWLESGEAIEGAGERTLPYGRARKTRAIPNTGKAGNATKAEPDHAAAAEVATKRRMREGKSNGCVELMSAGGGVAGGAVGSVAGPGGSAAGGLIGGAVGNAAGKAICPSG